MKIKKSCSCNEQAKKKEIKGRDSSPEFPALHSNDSKPQELHNETDQRAGNWTRAEPQPVRVITFREVEARPDFVPFQMVLWPIGATAVTQSCESPELKRSQRCPEDGDMGSGWRG